MIGFCWIFLIALISAAVLTGLLRRYALATRLIDIPNARSSHTSPTPRGGGLSIVIVFLLGLPVLSGMGVLAPEAMWALFGAGAWVALVGFLDDHGHIPARWRLTAHFIGAAWGLYWLGGLPPLVFFGYSFDPGWLGQILGLFYLIWLLNLYNFMDGIDGLASIEAITVCLGGALLYLTGSEAIGQWALPVLLAMTVAGFLFWNFPPARIFMGDAGSGFLGIVLGLFSIQAAWIAPQFFWSWLILLGVFIVDATWTLFRRFLRGEKIYEAHRSHAYQYASRYYGSHKTVSLVIGAINVCWLTPWALWVGLAGLNPLLGLGLAYVPLMLLAIYFRAGARELE
ncbi:MAG: glycosyltransferase family 4 protein [Methylococcaceae bacterium]|nr:glycosyltransferase family 4 protein [Methylococcaceae bacterium]